MQPTFTPRIKICCMASEAEAVLAVSQGASAVGLVSAMPSGPGPIPDALIARIARMVPLPVHTVLLTSNRRARDIAKQYDAAGTTAVQIVDRLEWGTYDEIREQAPGVKLVQVIHVEGDQAIDDAWRVAHSVDALLLDSGRPGLAVKELGGTGRRHDWSVSRRIREAVSIPVFLAGGLRADNAREAIETVGAYGLDVCTGVRTAGALDPTKLEAFMDAAGVARCPITDRMPL
jgi:phosphoribosylanthranilate isomerase